METNTITQADYTELCASLPDASVDMILTDPPYGTTDCSWDSVVPFDEMWHHFTRVIKPRGAIVMTAAQPFTSALVMSNPKMFKYSWVWIKNRPSNKFNAKIRPMGKHEDILVFSLGTIANGSNNLMRYYPQGLEKTSKEVRGKTGQRHHGFRPSWKDVYTLEWTNYPTTMLEISKDDTDTVHPTQKPVALFEYLIRTYTQAGDIVLDPFAGSGTTAVACIKTNRRYICGDQSAEYVELARKRIATCDPYQDTPVDDGVTQLSMFSTVAHDGE